MIIIPRLHTRGPQHGWQEAGTPLIPCSAYILAQVVATLLSHSDAYYNQAAFILDCLGGVFYSLRKLMQNEECVYTALRCVTIIAVIVGATPAAQKRYPGKQFRIARGHPGFIPKLA